VTNDERIVKTGPLLTLAGPTNRWQLDDVDRMCQQLPALDRRHHGGGDQWGRGSGTQARARGIKGSLQGDADADLVVLARRLMPRTAQPNVKQVWKFGVKILTRRSTEMGQLLGMEAEMKPESGQQLRKTFFSPKAEDEIKILLGRYFDIDRSHTHNDSSTVLTT